MRGSRKLACEKKRWRREGSSSNQARVVLVSWHDGDATVRYGYVAGLPNSSFGSLGIRCIRKPASHTNVNFQVPLKYHGRLVLPMMVPTA